MQLYDDIIDDFEDHVAYWSNQYSEEIQAQYNSPQLDYTHHVENAIVFNHDLRRNPDGIKQVIVADNPGICEQLEERYLIGDAGERACTFYATHLGMNFRHDAIILNKTPVHTLITNDLKHIELADGIGLDIMQQYMCDMALKLMKLLDCPLWIVGHSHFAKIFKIFADKIVSDTQYLPDRVNNIFVFKHFSRNWFLREYNREYNEEVKHTCSVVDPIEVLTRIGICNRINKLGF